MEQKYRTKSAVVAFIDVLGSSEAIRNNVNESLNAVHIAYDETKEERAFVSIIFFSALLQMNMWINNLLVRGGISCGNFFSDERMIWGNALIQAYKLEGQIAIYPRIIVEPEIAEIIKSIMKPEKGKLLCEDFDGIYFVDPFGIKQKKQDLYLINQFIDDNVIRLRNNQKDLKIYQKINWLQQYFCEKRKEMLDT